MKYITDLLLRAQQQNLTKEEDIELQQWLSDHPYGKVIYQRLLDDIKLQSDVQQLRNIDLQQRWIEFSDRMQEQASSDDIYEPCTPLTPVSDTIKIKKIRWWSYATAAVLLISGGTWLYKTVEQPEAEQIQLSDVAPGSNRAYIKLADGSRIELSGSQSGIVVNADHITYQDGSPLSTDLTSTSHQQIVVQTPRGGTYHVTLSDGTKVWLNASSSLSYPIQFTHASRTVELEGEAYFEVTKNTRPFQVISKEQTIKVLGTAFNVNSYIDETTTKTSLTEGIVQITTAKQQHTLYKNQESSNHNGILHIQTVEDVTSAMAWKEGYFQFEEANITDVMRTISRWYDVEIRFDGKVTDKKFSGMISREKTLRQTLEVMQATNSIQFIIEGRKVMVKS